MMRRSIELTLLALVFVASAARADTPPLRRLVYSFTYSSQQQGAVPNEPGSSGNRSYNGSLADKGTIAVDVLREASDRGLVVVVSEQGEQTRGAVPATCAVYGNTNVACDPTKQVNREEYAVLRFLGVNFVDPNKVDANGQWSVSDTQGSTKMTATYTLKNNQNGILSIDESRHIEDTSQGSMTFDAETKLVYDGPRLVPTSVEEYATEDRHSGVNGVYHTTYQTTLSLVSDSRAKP
ncbi:MAG: hypothetical protein JO104_12095 [Candidatus Eremiobacteraeota bacterium]|nr:hypothetical protein [Candidatus Eremiobacteraeota bacterium]